MLATADRMVMQLVSVIIFVYDVRGITVGNTYPTNIVAAESAELSSFHLRL
jgi:hypothetical protein